MWMKLTKVDGIPVLVNMNNVYGIHLSDDGGSVFVFSDGNTTVTVTESVDQITLMIRERQYV